MLTLSACIIGYLLCWITVGLVIGKVFYHKDVRQYGSGNLGGTNAGRVLGKKAGIAVILFDALKALIPVAIFAQFSLEAGIWCGLFVCVGHCYPVFANFKGGKAAASMFGFLFSIAVFIAGNIWVFIIPLAAFFLCLYLSKMVSLSSMVAAVTSTIMLIILQVNFMILLASILLSVLIIYRHKENISRILNGTERKITWM